MSYHVSRNGQLYGPYSLEDLQRYVATGNVLPTDMAKSEDMPSWLPVAQVLGATGAAIPPSLASAYPAPVSYTAPASPYPDPPNLQWAVVLLIGIFTCGLFITVWDIVQAVWMRRINRGSNALFLYIASIVINIGGTIVRIAMSAASSFHQQYTGVAVAIFVITLTLIELARFDMRRNLEQHYNGPEPIGLNLGPIMTFFFGSLYFQYHFNRINEVKQAMRYRGAAI